MIKKFQKEYRFLSNFWPCQVEYDGDNYPSVENAYQAAKFNKEERSVFKRCTAGEAKKLGQKATLVDNWEDKKIDIMKNLVLQKFTKNETLKQQLILTSGQYIEEGNTWGDVFWGTCNGVGKNNLGKIIMEVRENVNKK
jgi:ribA/ribD-fused uncharacterized protein